MCGFLISNDPRVGQENLDIIEGTLRFRGPDCASGLKYKNNWVAYHSRLSIIDVNSGSNQPVFDELGGILVFNGEILNFKELGRKYFDEDFTSDTYLLSRLLLSNRLKLSELDGFFAFVYINSEGKLAHAARDRFGVKPMFFYQNGEHITICSEPNTLKKLFDLEVNNDAIEEYKLTRAPIFSGSYFHDVDTVEPGTCLVNGPYFECLEFLNGSYQETSDANFEAALRKGVETRMVSDAPVGLLLSRGIDSNLIKEIGNFERYYSIGFSGDEDIEFLKANRIEGLTIVESSPESYLNSFKYLLELRGEPLSVPNEVLLYEVARFASNDGVKVLLSGEGADEFFAGYDRIFKWASTAHVFDLDTFLQMYCYTAPKLDSKLYNKFKSVFSENEFFSPFEAVRWFFIKYHMPVLFRRLDFSLMAAGVEGREPIANMHVFKYAVNMSSKVLVGEQLGKLPLRKIASKYRGNKFAFEKKVGFPVDLTKVFDNPNSLSSYELWFEENLKVLK